MLVFLYAFGCEFMYKLTSTGCKPTSAPCPPSIVANQMSKHQKMMNAAMGGKPLSVAFVCSVNMAAMTTVTEKMSKASE